MPSLKTAGVMALVLAVAAIIVYLLLKKPAAPPAPPPTPPAVPPVGTPGEVTTGGKSGKCKLSGGTVQKDAKTLNACMSKCQSDTSCKGYDINTSGEGSVHDKFTCTMYKETPTSVVPKSNYSCHAK